MERGLKRLARIGSYEFSGVPLGAWAVLILLPTVLIATTSSVDGIITIAVGAAFGAGWLFWQVTSIGAAVFTWKGTHYRLRRLHSPELLARSLAGVVAIVVGIGVWLTLFVLFYLYVPHIGE